MITKEDLVAAIKASSTEHYDHATLMRKPKEELRQLAGEKGVLKDLEERDALTKALKGAGVPVPDSVPLYKLVQMAMFLDVLPA